MALVVTNTLTRRKEKVEPREAGKISMYVCGPTVYNHIHIGNARPALVFDVIRRYLAWRGYEVTFVQNYTDVDDKIIDKAHQEGKAPEEVAAAYSRAFEEVMEKLQVRPPDILVKATDHITDMVATIEELIARGFAYEAGGSVWFAVEKFEGYGKLSGRTLDDVRAGERVEPDPNKKSPLDFALWKGAKPGEPAWDSPWGKGRPGWHIECSTMSTKYLGMSFDFHGGGSDLIFPHHENEIAQAEAASGQEPFVRYWLHNGMVNFDEQKMSKSLGNFVLVKDLLERVRPAVLRQVAISGHYRSDIDFGEASLVQAERSLERFKNFQANVKRITSAEGGVLKTEEAKEFIDRFTEAMDDDFNTPTALSVIHDLIKTANGEMEAATGGDETASERVIGLARVFDEMTGVLGIKPTTEPRSGADSAVVEGLIELAIELRNNARAEKRFQDADLVRDRLNELGVVLEDGPQGTRWKMKR